MKSSEWFVVRLLATSFLMLALIGCDSKFLCNPISNTNEAAALSKRVLLSDRMSEIIAKGGTENIFDNSEQGNFGNPCDRPERFHIIRHQWPKQPGEEYEVIWGGFVKGTCEGCWDTITIFTTVSVCGGVTVVFIARDPNRSEEKIFRDAAGNTTVQKAWSCGPRGYQ